MKNKLYKSISIYACLLLCLNLNACISYKAVQIKEIKSVEALNNDISSGKLIVNLRVVNPNNYAIKVKKYNLHAFVNQTDLGEVKVDEKIVMRKNSDEIYTMTFAPDANKILSILPDLLMKGSGELALKGSVRVKALILSKKFNVDLKKKVSVKDFR